MSLLNGHVKKITIQKQQAEKIKKSKNSEGSKTSMAKHGYAYFN